MGKICIAVNKFPSNGHLFQKVGSFGFNENDIYKYNTIATPSILGSDLFHTANCSVY